MQNAVFSNPDLCKKHFIQYIENTVKSTIKKYGLIKKDDRVLVAVSGGKDSMSCLYILSKWYRVEALAIDEGIQGYRDITLKDLHRFCKEHKIKLNVYSIQQEFGKSLDSILRIAKVKPCTVCGVLRRYMVNKYSRKLNATKLATGHNLDDESQAILMNFLLNQLEISARLGPKTGIIQDKKFIPRIKPLYHLAEREITAYSLLMGFGVTYVECPYTVDSYRRYVQELLNDYEWKHPGTKRNIIKSFFKMLPGLKKRFGTTEKITYCSSCGEPSKQESCQACLLVRKIKKY